MRADSRMMRKGEEQLDRDLDRNQKDIVDTLMTPHSYKMTEVLGSHRKIVSSVPAYNPEAQPTQARGGIVWSRAYRFQSNAPSYLDPVPDPGALTQAR